MSTPGEVPGSGTPPKESDTLATRYRGAEPIEFAGAAVYPLYSEQLSTPASALTITLLSTTSPAGLSGIGIGLTVIEGSIEFGHKRLAGVDIWRDALERGITVDLSADSADALFALTPVWADADGEPRSWVGNYGIVVERTETGRTVLWCSLGEGPPHFADLVVEVRSTPVEPRHRLLTSTVVPTVSLPAGAQGPAIGIADQQAIALGPPDHRDRRPPPPHRDVDAAEFEGYPCSFADIFWSSSDTDKGVAGSGFADFHEAAAARTIAEHRAVESHTTGRHAWVEKPELTGLIPVIRGTDLPHYGQQPPLPTRSAPELQPAGRVPTAGDRTEADAESQGNLALIDTVADHSLRPIAPSDHLPAEPEPARLHNLGAIAATRGDDARACILWTRAARAGHVGAAYDLGVLYLRSDDPATAERWWRAAAGRRMIRAMAALSGLLEQRGAETEALMWRTQAVAEEMIATANPPSAAESLAAALR